MDRNDCVCTRRTSSLSTAAALRRRLRLCTVEPGIAVAALSTAVGLAETSRRAVEARRRDTFWR
jgi:hypothetical protein